MAHGRELNEIQLYPFFTFCLPEIYMSPDLDKSSTSYFLDLIVMFRWAIKLVQSDISVEGSLLSRHLDLPHWDHFYQEFKFFTYLTKYYHAKLVLNPDCMFMDKKFVEKFNHNAECYNFYGDVREEISVDALQAYRNLGEITALPYDNHAGVWLTRWSHTRILIFPNDSHIVCYLKKQETI